MIGLALIGLATVYAVTMDPITRQPGHEFWTQVYAFPIGLVALLMCLLIDYRTLTQRSLLLYAALIIGLIAVMYFGVVRGGARRWLPVAGFSLQPSEFGRLALARAARRTATQR